MAPSAAHTTTRTKEMASGSAIVPLCVGVADPALVGHSLQSELVCGASVGVAVVEEVVRRRWTVGEAWENKKI